jgi:integrase
MSIDTINDAINQFCLILKNPKTESAYRSDLELFFKFYYLLSDKNAKNLKLNDVGELFSYLEKNYFYLKKGELVIVDEKKFNKLESFFQKKFDFSQLTLNHALAYIMLYRKKKANTRNRKRCSLRGFFTFLFNAKKISENVLKEKKEFKSESIPLFHRRYPTSEELERILEKCETLKEKAIIHVTFCTTIRSDGIRNMKVEDIDWDRNIIYIYGAKRRDPEHVDIYAMGDNTKQVLKEYIGNRESGYVFTSNWGKKRSKKSKRYSGEGLAKLIRTLGERASVKDLTTHSGKWCSINIASRSGLYTPKELQILAHHSKFATTERYLTADLDEVINKTKKVDIF